MAKFPTNPYTQQKTTVFGQELYKSHEWLWFGKGFQKQVEQSGTSLTSANHKHDSLSQKR